jgi:predicted RNA binding protein YcfA (HicA-like mRNA interferase family)
MKLPADWTGLELARALRSLGYEITRQSGSHMRLTTERNGQHHITVPAHDPLKLGTLRSILDAVAKHHGTTREALLRQLSQ